MLPLDLFQEERGLLMGCLSTRWHVARLVWQGTGGTVAEREDILVTGGLQRVVHLQLVDAVGLQAVKILQEVRGLHAGRPDHELGRYQLAAREPQAALRHFCYPRRRSYHYSQVRQQPRCRLGQARRQRGEDAIRGLDHVQANVFLRVDPVEAVGDQLPGRIVQFGSEFHARGAGADDRDL